MTRLLSAVASALAALLGLARPLAVPPLLPAAVPLVSGTPAWQPLPPLGLPGGYTPQTGGEP